VVILKRVTFSDLDCTCICTHQFLSRPFSLWGVDWAFDCLEIYPYKNRVSSLFIGESQPLHSSPCNRNTRFPPVFSPFSNHACLCRPQHDSPRPFGLQHGTRRIRYNWGEEAWCTSTTTEINFGIPRHTQHCFLHHSVMFWIVWRPTVAGVLTHMRLEFYLILVRPTHLTFWAPKLTRSRYL
jgi:hypothetical protein